LFAASCSGSGRTSNGIPGRNGSAGVLASIKYLAIIGSANSSKTEIGAMWGIISWMADPANTLVLVTSTTLKDSRKRMWGRIERLLDQLESYPG